MIPWNNESVWLDAWPQNKSGSLWPIFHGSVILPYILKAIWGINMILWANKSVWLDAWPQNKSWSLWPIFHGSVAYILKTILCIRRWHWPGVYVSPCSLSLVYYVHSFLPKKSMKTTKWLNLLQDLQFKQAGLNLWCLHKFNSKEERSLWKQGTHHKTHIALCLNEPVHKLVSSCTVYHISET